MIKSKFMNRNNVGIWSKANGIEWGTELFWNVNSKTNQYQIPSYARALSNKHSLQLEFEDFIHPSRSILLKKVTLSNESKEKQDLTLFFHQDFEHQNGTAFFSLSNRTLYHEYDGSYMLFNGLVDNKGISQYTTWQKNDFQNKDIVNFVNGSLFYNPISSGRVNSAFALETTVLPYEIKQGYYWMVFGDNLNEINYLNNLVKSNPEWLIREFIENGFSDERIIPLSK
ncbi:hypothetical protein M670_01931 [Schinkia azotoformans MEV2011]|uniref:Uncharacterized protein n=1 Tax=Schinkia azotoformans MEV2011 TaxID=1348973 RepID=A0A072NZQ6_SCHAZ|nr:hypothetical protein [Schinkia azotoformans]KEF38720.1 hypothetical protein M670_01931 [Schinkia azotoformans MEV2011]MEC1697051.1 hypothetical protein [Schinkia azotoformans]MEC1718090.1 hypothetical protein [Schinkia azotoformans]MEC1727064.1 hypothetical protein [Schinkia azotoformans]MEC1743547.1 hypothetical protein [Schinkia azotoformans]